MSKKTFVVAAVGLAAVLVAGGLVASNMGFKANYPLYGPGSALPGGGTSNSGTQGLALPYYAQTTITNAEQLIADINADGGAGCQSPNPSCVASVSRFARTTDSPESYTGLAGTNFGVTAGDGYSVVVTQDINYIIVGSHNPDQPITLDGPSDNGSNSGTQLWSYPYHSMAQTAEQLINEINLNGPGTVASVSRTARATDTPETYTGLAGTNFALVPGESYKIVVNAQIVNWKPDHY